MIDAVTEKSTIVRSIRIRTLNRDDAGTVLDAVFAAMSPRSRYLRFHAPLPRLPATVRAGLADVDGLRRAALVAELDGEPIGLASLSGHGFGTCEAAVAVIDRWQRHGVGLRLLDALTDRAVAVGYTAISASVLPENHAMLALARRVLPWARPWFDGDTIRIEAPIGPDAGNLTHEDLIADLYR